MDEFVFWLVHAVAVAIPVLVVTVVLLLVDAYANGENGSPARDRQIDFCAEKGLVQRSQAGKLVLNAEDGHGRDYDEIVELCREDSERFNVDPPNEKALRP